MMKTGCGWWKQPGSYWECQEPVWSGPISKWAWVFCHIPQHVGVFLFNAIVSPIDIDNSVTTSLAFPWFFSKIALKNLLHLKCRIDRIPVVGEQIEAFHHWLQKKHNEGDNLKVIDLLRSVMTRWRPILRKIMARAQRTWTRWCWQQGVWTQTTIIQWQPAGLCSLVLQAEGIPQ